MITVALIGFGGIAKAAHFPVYRTLEKEGKIKLVGIADISPRAFESGASINVGSTDLLPDGIRTFTDYREMLKEVAPDMADICLPTYLHASAACDALRAGCHVLSEKPMSLTYKDCLSMIETAHTCKKKLMVGQCLRFSRKYGYLKQAVVEGTFGKLRGGVFRRLSAPPVWGFENWYMDYERSHGCITDLHIHDIDLIRYLCGEPISVFCETQDMYSHMDTTYSVLRYEDFSLLAIGDWSCEGLPFTADFRVAFERATVDCEGDTVTVYPRGGSAFSLDFAEDNFYENEIRSFVGALETGNEKTDVVNPPESAAMTIKLIETLIKSAEAGGRVLPFRT